MINKQKSYGETYSQVRIKVKFNKRKLLKFLIIYLTLTEIILGVLWAIGY